MEPKPYPWKCPRCRRSEVRLQSVDYLTTIEHDGRSYEVTIPQLQIPCCNHCGKRVLTDAVNGAISQAFRVQAGLLAPDEIRQRRECLGLTQRELAGFLCVAEATLSRWETGAQIQQRCLDQFLRAFFDVQALRQYLGADAGTARRTIGAEPEPARPQA